MDLVDARWTWTFDKRLETEEDLVECPICKVYSRLHEWIDGEVYCELCGEHRAMVCPECDEAFDHVWSPEFRVIRNPQPEPTGS